MSNKTIVINGRSYDAATGLLVGDAPAAPAKPAEEVIQPVASRPVLHTAKIHTPAQQKSQTLRRSAVIKQAPVAQKIQAPTPNTGAPTSARPRTQDISRSPQIRRFAPHPVTTQKLHTKSLSDIAPQTHHSSVKLAAKQAAKADIQSAPKVLRPAQTIKEDAIESAMAQAVTNNKQYKAPRRKASRFMSVASASLAIVLLGGYFTYLNMPNLSVRVAAASAGIDASYPEYRPDGYRLNGAIASSNDQVSMKFASNAGPQNFTLTQKKSNWDSMAVSDHVNQLSESGAMTTTVDGLTIYIYGSNAAWVNGGILYSIEGDAPLSGDQIRRIATSL